MRALFLTAALVAAIVAVSHSAGKPAEVRYLQAMPNPAPRGDCAPPYAEYEAHVAVNPQDPGNLIATWIEGPDRSNRSVVVSRSIDAGATWSSVPIEGIDACSFFDEGDHQYVDPWLSFGLDDEGGTIVYLILHLLHPSDARTQDVIVLTSRDGGATWSAPRQLTGVASYEQGPDMARVSAHPTEPCRAYALWRTGYTPEFRTDFVKTADCGETWSSPQTLVTAAPGGAPLGSRILIHPSGTLLHLFTMFPDPIDWWSEHFDLSMEPTHPSVMVHLSADDGATWSDPVEIGMASRSLLLEPDGPEGRTIKGAYAFVAADISPEGTVYVAWSDNRKSVLLAHSTDAGKTWTTPEPVVTQEHGAFFPALASAPDGTVGLLYYDFRHDQPSEDGDPSDEALTVDVWFAHSRPDRLEEWEEIRVAGPFDMRSSGSVLFLGDYQGLAAFRGGFAAAFVMSDGEAVTTDGPSDAFFARIDLAGLGPPTR